MAAQPAKAQEIPPEEDSALHKHFEAMRQQILGDLSQYHPTAVVPPSDRLPPQYLIRANQPLPEFNTLLAKAFVAEDEKDPTRSLYALVCEPHMPVRGRVIKALAGNAFSNFVTLITSGITQVTGINGRRLVLIYTRPRGKSLAKVFAERNYKAFPEHFIMEHIIGPLGAVIDHCADLGFSHGRINPDNIFFAEAVTLGECASEPCGFSQPYLFETPERSQSHPAGKGEGTPAQDFFALGVLAAYLRLGPRLFDASDTPEKHLYRLLTEGSYLGFTRNIDFSDAMTDLLRGTLNDSIRERWDWQQLKLWAGGRRFNMLPPSPPPPGSRSFTVEKAEYLNLRDLSQSLFDHWTTANRMLRDGTIIRWVDLSVRRKDIAEILRKTVQSMGGTNARLEQQNEELVSRSITILDPEAPLSMKDVRMHLDGVGCMLAEAMRTGMQQHIQHIVELIEQGLASVWADMRRRRDEDLPGELNNALWVLDRMRMTLKKNSMGFGLERCLYDLNPDLPCQSPLLGDNHVHSLKDLLLALDRIAPEKARDHSPIDRHIAAFISSRLSLSREVWLTDTNQLAKMAQKPSVIALKLFEQAQEGIGRTLVPGLTRWVSMELLTLIEHFHSKTIREQLEIGILKLAAHGHFHPLHDFFNQKAFLEADVLGFRDAHARYHMVKNEIALLRNRYLNHRRAARSGYIVAKYISYIGLFGVITVIIRKFMN